MGCLLSVEEKQQKQVTADIDKTLKEDGKKARDEVKMLLLGSGESGKSTILKQMKLIHSSGYTEAEKKYFKEVIFSNTIFSMKQILDAMITLNIPLSNPDNEKYVKCINEMPTQIDTKSFPQDASVAITHLWNSDDGILKCYNRAQEYQLNDSAKYFFENLARIVLPDFSPTEQDILRSRVKTTSIIETSFFIGDLTYKLFDVGGQRSERKKWIHCFDGVTAILFLVAISEYDQVLYEDKNINRLTESTTLFESICNSKWFVNTSLILFLNKKDVFSGKIITSPIEKCWPDYEGGEDYDLACEYMKDKFEALNSNADKKIYTHYTCATDTDQVKMVLEAVYDIIVQGNLRASGLL